MTVESTDCLVLPCHVLTTIPSIPYPPPPPQLWDKDLVAPLLFWENFWIYKLPFLYLQNGGTNQLRFACIMRISWKKGTWSLFVSSVELFVFWELLFALFFLLLISKGHLWSWKDELRQGKKRACRGEWLSKVPEWIGVLGSCPVLSNITIQC